MTVTQSVLAERSCAHIRSGHEGFDIGKKLAHGGVNKCVLTHRQGVIHRTYPRDAILCETTHMQTANDLEQVRAALRRLMLKKDIKAKPLSLRAGLGETAVRDIFQREQPNLRLTTLRALAGVLEVGIEDFFAVDGVMVTGRVGAGGTIIFEAETDLRSVPRLPGITMALQALEVVGDSMLPKYSQGDIIYIEAQPKGVQDASLGEYCAVRLTSGETYVKLLARGSSPGFFTLRSLNAADIEDVELEWATPVVATLSRAALALMR